VSTLPDSTADVRTTGAERLFVLDGFRALSILFVLAAHMLPLGPHRFELNFAAGELGMVLFFTLSGFLITQQLHAKRDVLSFFVRRLFRIVPLAWAYSAFALLLVGAGLRVWLATLGFAMTYDLSSMRPVTGHLWSLCVEVHFYLAVGLLMAITRFRGFVVLPLFWLLFVVLRLVGNPLGTIETHLRVDEILSGAVLALVYLGHGDTRAKRFVVALPLPLLVAMLLLACHPVTGALNAARGLFASLVVGHVLLRSDAPRFAWLGHRVLRYIAEVSYAVYVIHPITMYGWLGSGGTIVKYLKRPLCFALTFGIAHLSTYHFERFSLDLGKRLAKRVEMRGSAPRALAVDVPAS
jgi:peptidoglycan/LPS O-acetylase OafA/YrhL